MVSSSSRSKVSPCMLGRLDDAQVQLLALRLRCRPGWPCGDRPGACSWRRSERDLRMVAGLISTQTARMTRRKKRKMRAITPHCMTPEDGIEILGGEAGSPRRPRSLTSSRR